MRAGRLGGGALWSAWSELATVLDGGGGTGRPIVEDRAGGGAGAGAVRLGGSDGTLLVAALDPDASVVAETFDEGAGGARGGARGGRWNGRSGGGGGGSVGAGADDVAERGIGGGFARPAIFANHQRIKYLIDAEFKKLCLLVAVAAAGFSFGIPPAKSPPSCGGPPPPPAGVELAPLERPETGGTAADPIPTPPTLPPPPPPPPAFFPSIRGVLRSFVTAFLSDFPP